jgi:hypothetical protein
MKKNAAAQSVVTNRPWANMVGLNANTANAITPPALPNNRRPQTKTKIPNPALGSAIIARPRNSSVSMTAALPNCW